MIGALVLCSPIRASEDAIACVAELAIPSSYSPVYIYIPATIEVHIEVGEGGKARSVTYDTQVLALKNHLNGYFKEKTRYLDVCRGKTITFKVQYVVVEPPLDIDASEVRFKPPDQFLVICHRLNPSFDPVRPNQLKRK